MIYNRMCALRVKCYYRICVWFVIEPYTGDRYSHTRTLSILSRDSLSWFVNTGREIYRWSIYRSFHNNIKNDLVVHKWNKITPSTLWSKVDHSTIFCDKALAPRSKGSSKEHTKNTCECVFTLDDTNTTVHSYMDDRYPSQFKLHSRKRWK